MNNEIRYMKTPHTALKAKMNNKSKPYLMLAELIDNSIGSWEQNNADYDLTIFLRIDLSTREIICIDNAFGMNSKELLDSVELDDEKQGNTMNMFGVGMKNAAFWFGQDLIIISNDGNETNTTSVRLSKVKNLKSPVQWSLESDSKKLRIQGTEVRIENVYDDRLMTTSEIEKTIIITETKYRRYLMGTDMNQKVNISYEIIDKKGNSKTWELEPHPEISQIIPEFDVDDFIKNIKSNFKETEVILEGLKDKAIFAAENYQPLSFIFYVPFDGEKIKFKIGITKQNDKADGKENKFFKPHYGINAYQNNRGIRIAGVNPIDFPKQDYTRTNIKRIHASCELGDFFRPDNNKSDFNFGVRRDEFNSLLQNMGKDLILLADAVVQTIGKNARVSRGSSEASREKIAEALKAKSDNFSWEKFEKYDTTMSFEDKEEKKWNVKISEVDVDNVEAINYFVNSKILRDKTSIEIQYNVNHPIWKPLVSQTNSIDLKTVIYPLITILGLAKIGIENNLISTWTGKGTEDYLESISQLAKFGLKI